jgi:hypothetical protein
MDALRFDALTRSLTESRSRRGALSALLGGALGLLGLGEATVKARKKKDKKKKRKPLCSDLGGVWCGGKECCYALEGEQCCPGGLFQGPTCVASPDCCTVHGAVKAGKFNECGLCQGGELFEDPNPCLSRDPTGCNPCNHSVCYPITDGVPCLDGEEYSACGVCVGGKCKDRYTGGAPRAGCGGFCCPAGDSCCNGQVCYRPDTHQCCIGHTYHESCDIGLHCCPIGVCVVNAADCP